MFKKIPDQFQAPSKKNKMSKSMFVSKNNYSVERIFSLPFSKVWLRRIWVYIHGTPSGLIKETNLFLNKELKLFQKP